MITKEEIISGTEKELLVYFKEKYNLIENKTETPKVEEPVVAEPIVQPPTKAPAIKPVPISPKPTSGFSNLFGGTSWGN